MIRKIYFGHTKFECSNCGTEVNENDKYCHICGNKLFAEKQNTLHSQTPKFIKKVKIDNYYLFEDNCINLNFENEYKKQLLNQIPLLRIESFFYCILRFIFQEDYLKHGLAVEKSQLLDLYYQTSTKILKDNASIILDSLVDPNDEYQTSFEWSKHHIYYGKQLEIIIDTVLNVINYDEELKRIINIREDENPYFSKNAQMFIRNLIVIAYSQATQRIEDEFNNNNFFGIEIIKNNTDEELIIYLTPKGLMEAPEIFNKIDKENRIPEFNKMINQIGIQTIVNEELKKQYNTSAILVYRNNIYCHYKQDNLSYNDFFNKRINRPHFSSIFMESQANYRKI